MSMRDLKILVVHDMESMREFISDILVTAGCGEVNTKSNGKTALHELEHAAEMKTPYHFVVSDIKMPFMDGFELFRKIKKDDRLAETQFVFASADSDPGNVKNALIMGAGDFWVIPFNVETVKNRLTAASLKNTSR